MHEDFAALEVLQLAFFMIPWRKSPDAWLAVFVSSPKPQPRLILVCARHVDWLVCRPVPELRAKCRKLELHTSPTNPDLMMSLLVGN